MRAETKRNRVNGRNGRKPNPAGAIAALDAAIALKRRHGSQFKGMTRDEIMARIKKTREELVRERFGYLFG